MSKAIIGMLVVIVIVGGYLVLKPNKPSEVEVAKIRSRKYFWYQI
jgi:hypothetical protein